jgi:hypothetical protein
MVKRGDDVIMKRGKDIVIAVCDSPMGRQHPFFYLDLETEDPKTFCEAFVKVVKWDLVKVVMTGLQWPSGLSAQEIIDRFVKNAEA